MLIFAAGHDLHFLACFPTWIPQRSLHRWPRGIWGCVPLETPTPVLFTLAHLCVITTYQINLKRDRFFGGSFQCNPVITNPFQLLANFEARKSSISLWILIPDKANPVYNEFSASPKWFVITGLLCIIHEWACVARGGLFTLRNVANILFVGCLWPLLLILLLLLLSSMSHALDPVLCD